MHLFYIEKENFLRTTFETLIKDSEHSIYATDETDVLYLIEDQKPEITLISLLYDQSEVKELVRQIGFLEGLNTKIGLIGTSDEFDKLGDGIKVDFQMVKPIEAASIIDQLNQQLGVR